MRFITTFYEYLNENLSPKFSDLAKGVDYETFLHKTYFDNSYHKVLYRGSGRELEDNIFMTDDLDHAEQYGEDVDGIVSNTNFKDTILHFDNGSFNELRDNFGVLISDRGRYLDFDYDEYESTFKEKLREIYSPYFEKGKLSDAMYQLNKDEDKVIDYVYDFITNSTDNYRLISMNKQNDFLIPLLMYYAKRDTYNIISFWGSDYGGSMEYVVGDISKYTKLSDIWENSK